MKKFFYLYIFLFTFAGCATHPEYREPNYLTRSDQAAPFIEESLFDQYALSGGIRVGF